MRDEEHAALSPSRSRVRKNDKEIEIPVLGATYALGQELIGASNLTDVRYCHLQMCLCHKKGVHTMTMNVYLIR